MAEGRMLSNRVARSSKVAALSSDTARMIYSWLIPYTDVEGRMEADPRLLKADTAPLLEHVTVAVINNVLLELHEIGLIVLYSSDDGLKEYLQITKFEENQKNLRKDREAPSRIVGPTPAKVRRRSGVKPDELPSKIREVKIKLSEVNTREDVPVDNSEQIPPDPTAREEEKPDPLFADLKTIIEAINEKLTPYNQRQVMMFVESNMKGKNHSAIIHCLQSLLKKLTTKQEGEEVRPRAYLEAALNGDDERAGEDGKHNAEDHEQQARDKKGPATAAGLQAFGRIMAEIGRASP